MKLNRKKRNLIKIRLKNKARSAMNICKRLGHVIDYRVKIKGLNHLEVVAFRYMPCECINVIVGFSSDET